jgi:hypothetical protein
LLIDAAEDFDSSEDVEATVEPATVRDRIHVAADEQGAFGLASQSRPEITCGIRVNFDRKCFELFLEPIAGGEPRLGKGDALSAVFIGGETAQVFEFGDCAFGV